MPQQLTVNEIRNRALTGEAKEVADFVPDIPVSDEDSDDGE
jgi:hypothetical protein